MSTNYRLLLLDDFDWDYVGNTKKDTISTIISKNLEIEASLYCLIILNVGKAYYPDIIEDLEKEGVSIDACYYQEDNCSELKLYERKDK